MYQIIMSFLRRYLEASHIHSYLLSPPIKEPVVFDNGLRNYLFESPKYEKLLHSMLDACQLKTVYFLTDTYGCHYVLAYLPDGDCLFVGPYSYVKFDEPLIYRLARQFQVPADKMSGFKSYYYSLPFVSQEERFVLLILTFMDEVYGSQDSYTVDFVTTPFDEQMLYGEYSAEPPEPEDTLQDNEARYQLMADLLAAVKTTNAKLAIQLMHQFLAKVPGPRFSNPLKDAKNWLIVFNTSLRMTAEQANVHSYYLGKISAKFSFRIDALTNPDHKTRIMQDMIRQYCLLIQNHAECEYSRLIQRVLIMIEANLASDLSLKAIAGELNINASYLSHLFKKEVGITLTEYVNKTRIEESLVCLNGTDMQIQAIGQKVGIYDLAYFTKLFKKQIGMSPSDYRKSIRSPSGP